jgi:hypothetical protein
MENRKEIKENGKVTNIEITTDNGTIIMDTEKLTVKCTVISKDCTEVFHAKSFKEAEKTARDILFPTQPKASKPFTMPKLPNLKFWQKSTKEEQLMAAATEMLSKISIAANTQK